MPPKHVEADQKDKPRPGYFLVRASGEVVPLIAVDELPPGTDLVDIPRSLDLEVTTAMLNLGLQRSSGFFYQVIHGREKEGAATDSLPRTKYSRSTLNEGHD